MANRRPSARSKRKIEKGKTLPFTRTNYLLFLFGLVIIVLGYIALSRPPAINFWSLTVSPILLVVGYCVVFPIAIMWRGRGDDREGERSSS